MALLDGFFGQVPSYMQGLLGEEEYKALTENINQKAQLNTALALLQGGAPRATPTNLGAILGSAMQVGQSTFEDAATKSLGDIAKTMQVKELVRKQREDEKIKQLLSNYAIPQYQTDDAGNRQLVGMTYDMKSVIPTLQALGRFDLIKDIGESQKSIRQSGIMGDANAPSPFAPYLQATNPAVRQLATQLESGFKRGIIDEETAYKRLEPLAKMEESYVAKSEKAAEGKKPTEGEKNAAGFAQTMEFAEANLNKITNQVAKEKLAGKDVGDPYATARTQFLGGVPLAGDYLQTIGSSKQQNLYRQAQENWVRAKLRKESGAAIGKDEMEKEIATFFPTAGESRNPEIVAQKAMARKVAIESMKKSAGSAYEPFDMRKFMQNNGLEGR